MNLLSGFFKRPATPSLHRAYFEAVLGTSLEIQIIAANERSGPDAETRILREIDRLEAIFNAYKAGSELRIWQESFQTELPVSSELAEVLEIAEKWRAASKGAFNPAVEALTRLWKRHEAQGVEVDEEELAPFVAQLQKPLWSVDQVKVTATRHTALAVTLNSIAKGYIIDSACLAAAQLEGVEQVLLNIGGDIRHYGDQSVTVGIADPRSDAENAAPVCRVALCNQGIATSGNYRRGFQIGSQWYSHVLDPRTGRPVESLVGVSAIAPDAMTADVLATAFSVLEPEESLQMADGLGNVGVFLIDAQGAQFSNSFWDKQRK